MLAIGRAEAGTGLLHLTWNDCPGGVAAASNRDFSCATSTGSHTLVFAVETPAPVDSVLGLELVLDVQTQAAAVPDWWRAAPGDCRDGALVADGDLGPGACEPLWNGKPAGGLASQTIGMPRGGPNQFRLVISLARPANQMTTLVPGTVYYAARLVVRNDLTGVCGGCAVPACFVFNSATLKRPARPDGAPSADVVLDGSGGGASHVTWQGPGAACETVPVRRSTWGSLKGLYR